MQADGVHSIPPLHTAVIGDHVDIAKLLLAHGADPDAVTQVKLFLVSYRKQMQCYLPAALFTAAAAAAVLSAAVTSVHAAWTKLLDLSPAYST